MIAIDSHAHIYEGTDPLHALVAGGIRLLQADDSVSGAAILLCEPAGQDLFARVLMPQAHGAASVIDEYWRVEPTDETVSVKLVGAANESVVVVRGQQLVTAENLEILAVGHDGHITDGQPLQTTIESARAAGSNIILPWGAGKWLGARGRLIDDVIEQFTISGFHLGDNGGRPFFWSVPQFAAAAKKGIKVLRGSDPLPIPNDENRLGTFASIFPGELDTDEPWRGLASILENPEVESRTVGSPMGCWRFVRSQSILRAGTR